MRQTVRLITIIAALLPATLLAILAPAADVAAAQRQQPFGTTEQALDAAIDWLVGSHQNEDGGYSSFSVGANQGPSDVVGTLDALGAIAPANGSLAAAPLSYLEQNAPALTEYANTDGSAAGKVILGLLAAGHDPRAFAGEDYVVRLTEHFSPTGEFGVTTPFQQALAIYALAAAGETAPEPAIEWLMSRQADEGSLAGSWDDGFGTAGNPDATAMAILALLRSGLAPQDGPIRAARDFLAASQLPTGEWEYGLGFGGNANSTALALQALVALDEPHAAPTGPWIQGGVSPLNALLAWQSSSGAFQADFGSGRADDFFSTVQAIPALIAAAHTSAAPAAAPANGPDWLPWLLVALALGLVLAATLWATGRRR
jgi:squalene cyclase